MGVFDKLFGRTLLNRFTKLIAVNWEEISWIKKFGINPDNIELIPNGIPKDYFKKIDTKQFKRKNKMINDELMVLSVGRIHKSKGFDQVIKVASSFPKIRFFIAGGDEGQKAELISLKKSLDLDNVSFLGKVSEKEKMEAFAAADIFCHPSHYEAFGIVVLEAMSQRCAVITSDSGGLPWVVGDCGLTFKDNDLKDLKTNLNRLINNSKLRANLALLGYEKAKGFRWDKITDQLEKVYLRELKNHNKMRKNK